MVRKSDSEKKTKGKRTVPKPKQKESEATPPAITRQRRPINEPPRRSLKIFAFDPMLGRVAGNRITIDIPYEKLEIGPSGGRIEVIDFDSSIGKYYEPVDLNDPNILLNDGLDPSESDPRFHQQMTYAVARKVLENFDVALGTRITFGRLGTKRLRLYPHAFRGTNACFWNLLNGVAFGYFQADKDHPGNNIPGQTIYTCLSHDIIAHEVTHALIWRLRRSYDYATNFDVGGFHEGFSDIVAIFQHFSFKDILKTHIADSRGDLRSPKPLIELAQQFGHATGQGKALRTAASAPDPKQYEKEFEAHERGSILVAAVFDAFFKTYETRVHKIVSLATDGLGLSRPGELHPDLVSLLAGEAESLADTVLKICIRAFQYLPAVDVTYGDFLRALVTADKEYSPLDRDGFREAIVESFRQRGIYPDSVVSLAEESLVYEEIPKEDSKNLLPVTVDPLQSFIYEKLNAMNFSSDDVIEAETLTSTGATTAKTEQSAYSFLHQFASNNHQRFDLHPTIPIEIQGFHPTYRIGLDGRLLTEYALVLAQKKSDDSERDGGLPEVGGTVAIFRSDGSLKYKISKPLMSDKLSAEQKRLVNRRADHRKELISWYDSRNNWLPWSSQEFRKNRIRKATSIAALHRGL